MHALFHLTTRAAAPGTQAQEELPSQPRALFLIEGLQTFREASAKFFHVILFVHMVAAPLQTGTVLFSGFFPAVLRHRHL